MSIDTKTPIAPGTKQVHEEAVALLKKQLKELDGIAERHYQEVAEEARQWIWQTEAIVAKAFGKDSPQYEKIAGTRKAAQRMQQHYDGGPEHERLQLAYEDRSRQRKTVVKSLIQELEMMIEIGN